MSILEVNNIYKKYGDYYAVKDVSFNVGNGNVYGILGPNGAGKTTTIRMIMNIIQPDTGKISLFGKHMNDGLKSKIGYLPEERGLYKKMKCIDVLIFLGELHEMGRTAAKESALIWLDKFHLSDNKNNRVDELSKGMQQKLQIIATIMHSPDLIILDEPFSGLDPVNLNLVKDIIVDLKKEGKAIMFSTHMMDSAEKLCDDILMINKGSKVMDGKLNDILNQHGKNSIQIEFNGNENVFKSSKLLDKVESYPNYVEVELKGQYSANDLLKEVLDKVDIISVKTRNTSLNEIFLELAGGSENE